MQMFKLSFEAVMIRYYLMMAAVIIAGFVGNWWIALLALPIFLSCLTGLTFGRKSDETTDLRNEPVTKSFPNKHVTPVQNAA